MRLMTELETLTLLQPDLPIARACVEGAWGDYHRRYAADVRQEHSLRSRASLMHDLMTIRARDAFGSVPHAQVQEVQGLFMVLLHGRVAVRFKKLDEHFRSSGIATQQSLEFTGQQFDLPGVPKLATLEAGYQLNLLETELAGVYLAYPRSASANHWLIDLRDATGRQAEVVPHTAKPRAPETTIRIVARTDRRKEQTDGEGQ